ncbi:uncharacterized protein LOC127243031 isoform X2 [Andrographis paniculata]|uniref:uncharacterized protein LOC127243031 isoform X2 n=1 Tax=Andrographis paniculata TaxID=175694 RepID=UPI0021E89450|nr:uncharacterized protein LOC127243031 isoform X2 [Andrographis paniculata]
MDHDRYFYCAAHADYHSESDSLSLSSRVPNPKSSMEIEGILFCLRLRVRFAAAGMDLRRTIGQFSQSLISHWISDVSFAEMILRGAVGRLALTLSPIAARLLQMEQLYQLDLKPVWRRWMVGRRQGWRIDCGWFGLIWMASGV